VSLIHDAGGVAVVAHPYWDVKDPDQVRDLVESLARESGLDGVEAFYPDHTRDQTAHCLELCRELELVPTGSSDFHGPTHKTFSRFGAYDTYGLGEPQVPPRPA
jgi:3',5'-nucleoside bisphosphate phosphatase